MKKPLIIIGGAIAGILLLGAGSVLATQLWLDGKLENQVETQVTDSTGVKTDVGKVDVQLLQKRVTLGNIQLANLAGFSSPNIITINQIEFVNVSPRNKPPHAATAVVNNVQVYVDGTIDPLADAKAANGMPKLNLLQFIEQIDKQNKNNQSNSNTSSVVMVSNTTGSQQQAVNFSIDKLTIRGMIVKLNLQVPWQKEAIAHEIPVAEMVLADVNNLNIGEKIANNLGTAFTTELQNFFLKEILPNAMRYSQKSAPKDANIPPNIKLP